MADKQSPIAAGYYEFLQELKERIRSAQVRAALAVNQELVLLYWQIGRDILTRQQQLSLGSQGSQPVVEGLALMNFPR